ncbi:MAG: FISUMP domain-containing protein [Bacteroidota bacterium]
MKKLTILSLFLMLQVSSLYAQSTGRGTVTDRDGNVYRTVGIGRYEWMAENLRTTSYNNGTKIPYVTGNNAWTSLRTDAFCLYNDNDSITGTCGALYNWYSVNTGKLCPEGWRVPTDDEWKFLEGSVDSRHGTDDTVWNNNMLRGYNAGQQLKAPTGWRSGLNGRDHFGFSAMPCGEHLSNGRYFLAGSNGFWWSSNEYGVSTAWYRSLIYSFEEILRGYHDKRFGFSIRCVRDR